MSKGLSKEVTVKQKFKLSEQVIEISVEILTKIHWGRIVFGFFQEKRKICDWQKCKLRKSIGDEFGKDA